MIEVGEAVVRIRRHVARELGVERLPLKQVLGRRLAAEITSPRDVPPQAKSLVDGYAILESDLSAGRTEFELLETIAAGEVPRQALQPGQTSQVMTGAPVPPGAAAVIMREHTDDAAASGRITFRLSGTHPSAPRSPYRLGMNIAAQGASIRLGESIFASGRVLSSVDVGILAELGLNSIPVQRRPRVAVLSTGNELRDVGEPVSAGQSYNSNGPLLTSLLERLAVDVLDLGICRDDESQLRAAIERGLSADLLVITGGVSAGNWDLVPAQLAHAGVECEFHHVRLKPGKPLWFGIRPASDTAQASCLVYGLPGNPVSALVCFHLFAAPILESWQGGAERWPTEQPRAGVLQVDWEQRCDRPTFWPATLERRLEGELDAVDLQERVIGSAASSGQPVRVRPLPWRGSFDLRSLADAEGLVFLDAGEHRLSAGDPVPWIPLIR